jgi:phytanoyl-CoA hydroxylase
MSATDAPTYFSEFGGLWTDRADAEQEIQRRLAAGRIDEPRAAQLRDWIRLGYTTLPGAVPVEAIDRFREEISRAFEQGDERLLCQPGSAGEYVPLKAGTDPVRSRVVDSFAFYGSARDLLFAQPIVDWLALVFDDDPMLFQSLSFDRGSQQGMHQDSAYVVVSRPLEFCGVWIALEDVQAGSGELMYYEGSHRLPEYRFSGAYKHWNPERDGDEQHDEWNRLLNENAAKMGLERRTFLARKGDALVWAADLAHGGAPVEDPELTRRSLVGHYCPRSVDPNWFRYRQDRFAVVPSGNGAWFASEYYDLSAEAEAAGQQAAAADQAAPAAEPASEPDQAAPAAEPAPSRRGGLVGKVRKLLRD